jgi:hypothetical protein
MNLHFVLRGSLNLTNNCWDLIPYRAFTLIAQISIRWSYLRERIIATIFELIVLYLVWSVFRALYCGIHE